MARGRREMSDAEDPKPRVRNPPPPQGDCPIDAVAMYNLRPPSTAELAAVGYSKYDYFSRADWDALARPKPKAVRHGILALSDPIDGPGAKVVDIATRRAIDD
jgi:hypothetical protein